MAKIKFGTDGWRAIIADEFTVFNVRRIAQATSDWMISKRYNKAIVGYDCRFGGRLFADTVSKVFAAAGHDVLNSEDFISAPMLSLGLTNHSADIGIIITASHNPPEYNGYKIKSSHGGPLLENEINEIEALIPEIPRKRNEMQKELDIQDLVETINLESEYVNHVLSVFSIESIRAAHLMLVYDAMYGAGHKVFPAIIPEALRLRCENNPSFQGQTPEPTEENLVLLSQLTASTPYTCCGFATDGDADRIGLLDEYGKFVDASKIMLLLLYYHIKYKGLTGKVIGSCTITDNVRELAQHFGLEYVETKIGFKYLAEKLYSEDVLLAGEESGGFAVKGHILDRDGIWTLMCILDLLVESGKTVSTLLDLIYKIVRKLEYERRDIRVSTSILRSIEIKCGSGELKNIGELSILRFDNKDGYKYYLTEDEWVMIRPSGNEPKVRIYAQASTKERTSELIETMLALVTDE